MRSRLFILAVALLHLSAMTGAAKDSQKKVIANPKPFVQTGKASWYGNECKGVRTASGERYKPDELTAAHRKLPFGTMVRVTNLRNNRSVILRITNRGPYIRGRIIDVSRAGARALDMMHSGVARVRIEAISADEAATPPGA